MDIVSRRQKIVVTSLFTAGWIIILMTVYALFLRDMIFYRGVHINLPNGFTIQGGSRDKVILYKPEPFVDIGPNVDGYKVFSNAIAGHTSCSFYNKNDSPGYFIVDTKTSKVYQGLSKKKWMEVLGRYGINKEPQLHRPTKKDEKLGFNKP